MDPDSFLNPVSPELWELCDPSFSPSSRSSFMDTPAHDINAQPRMNHPSLNCLAAADHNSSHLQNAPYRSVFRLSDVASALLQAGFSPTKPGRPPTAPLGPSKHGRHAFMPKGAMANLGDKHPENKLKMTRPFTMLTPAASSPSALPPAPFPSASPNLLSASPPLHPLPEKIRPSKRMKTSSLGPTSTVCKDTGLEIYLEPTKPFNREGMSQREIRFYTETQRRKRMRESFSILQSLVPKLKLKHTNRITVLIEVIEHIRSLHVTLEELERKRSDIMSLLGISEEDAMGLSPYWCIGIGSYNRANYGDVDSPVKVTVRSSGSEVFISLNTPKCKGVWSRILMLLHKYNVEVVNATLATASGDNFHCIHGKTDSTASIESMDLQDKLERVILKQLSKQHKEI